MKRLLAQTSGSEGLRNPALNEGLQSPEEVAYISQLIPNIIGLAFVIGAIVFFLIMLVGAIQWITSGGDKASLEGARGKITSAFFGIVILFATYAIVKVLESFFGISILEINLEPLIIK